MPDERNYYRTTIIFLSVLCALLTVTCLYLGYNRLVSDNFASKDSSDYVDAYVATGKDLAKGAVTKTDKEIEALKLSVSAYSTAAKDIKKYYDSSCKHTEAKLPVLPAIFDYKIKNDDQNQVKSESITDQFTDSKDIILIRSGLNALKECHQGKVVINATELLLIANNYPLDSIYKDLSWQEVFKYVAQEAYIGCKQGNLESNANILKSCIEIQGVTLAMVDPTLTINEVESYCLKAEQEPLEEMNDSSTMANLPEENSQPCNNSIPNEEASFENNASTSIAVIEKVQSNHMPDDWINIIDIEARSPALPLFMENQYLLYQKDPKLSPDPPNENTQTECPIEEDAPEPS